MKYGQNEYTKLNLGCGQNQANKFPVPWLNVDCFGTVADYHCNVFKLPETWVDSFDEVRASHVLEHLFLNQMNQAISEWARVLRRGGLLRVVVPDMDIVMAYLSTGFDGKQRKSVSVYETTAVLAQIYGIGYDDSTTEGRWRHRFLFNEDLLRCLLAENKYLMRAERYSKELDPASMLGINDDSQNEFSLCMIATKT